ncbi:uncharacterized protein LOC143356194 isoform X2 [Halictus rubicundus]|uniref:uncharacterized protein LOC143356194 isoform X2 n=1 Tax=Halictus rubicundus TaxID=77578 RepID=UPI0040370D89
MEVFQGNYKIYYSLMCFMGLWPYNNSIPTKIYRSAVLTLICGAMVIQLSTMRNSEMTLNDIIVQISFCFSLLIEATRYFTSLLTLSSIKYVFENMQKDYTKVKDSVEVELLLKHSIIAKRIMQSYFALTCGGTMCLFLTLGMSTLLQSDIQLRFLHHLGFYYNERSLRSNFTCWYLLMSVMFGLSTVACTEGSICVFATYLSGLLEIASYRIRNAVNNVANSDALNVINIRPVVEIHCDAIKHSKKYTNDLMITYIATVMLVVVAFGLNIYRLFMTITLKQQYDEVLISLYFVGVYLAFICGNNYSGQILLDSSINFHNETYNSLWYRIPPKLQKMVLLTMVKSQTAVEFNLAGLFVPCYEGFTMMISSSFSYFTLLCSVQ